MTAEQLCQWMLDEQGFIVIWHMGEARAIGDVVPALSGFVHGDLEHHTVVIANATREEFDAQSRRFSISPLGNFEGLMFYKVAAE